MSEDQFTKLFKYMERRFDEILNKQDGKFAILEEKIDKLQSTMDSMIKKSA